MDRPSVSNRSDWSATKRSVQQSSVNRPVHSEHSPVTPGPRNTGTGQTGHLRHSEHWSSGIGHTDNQSDHEHSVHRSRSARSNAVDHQSILLNCTLQEHRSELEHGSASNRTRHRSDVSRSSWRNSSTHRATIPLRHADPSEHSTALMLRHRRVRSCSRSYDSVFLRRHSRSSSCSRGKKKKLHRRGNTLPLLVLLIAAPPPLLLLEKEQGNGTSLKEETH